jgi:hypothetical protein
MFFVSCSSKEQNSSIINYEIDSILKHNGERIIHAETISKKSDSLTHNKIQNNIKQFNNLQNLVKLYKENITVKEIIVYKTDTVIIENNKSFWGKTKTNTSVKVDTQSSKNLINIKVDSILHNEN